MSWLPGLCGAVDFRTDDAKSAKAGRSGNAESRGAPARAGNRSSELRLFGHAPQPQEQQPGRQNQRHGGRFRHRSNRCRGRIAEVIRAAADALYFTWPASHSSHRWIAGQTTTKPASPLGCDPSGMYFLNCSGAVFSSSFHEG